MTSADPLALVVCLLTPVVWSPPGVPLDRWRAALAEDVVDLLAPLPLVRAAIAATPADLALARSIAWPGMPVIEVPEATPRAALRAAETSGQAPERIVVLAADVPDLPAMLIGKLLRPLGGTRQITVAPATDGGLIGVAALVPVPAWLSDVDIDSGTAVHARDGAPTPTAVVSTPGWHRQRGPADLARLDPALDGWDTTRTLLSA